MARAASPRNSELTLLLVALIVGGGALALVALGKDPDRPDTAIPYAVALVICYIFAHFAVRYLAKKGDALLLPLTALLNALGLAAIFRLTTSSPDEQFGPAQLVWTAVGTAFFVGTLALIRDHRVLARYKYILGFLGVGLLLLPLSPLGATINGAQLWLRFGSYSFQPGELAKLCLVIFFAAYLAERKELLAIASRRVLGMRLPDIKHFGPLLVMWGLSLAVMFFEKDLGSSLLFFSIFLVMIYIATSRVVYMVFGFGLFSVGAYFGYQYFAHVQTRVQVWLDVFDPQRINDEGYQLAQSLFALATGGIFGTGFGQGRPDLIPEAQTDFVFSVLGEELGLLGTTAVLLCFLLIVARGLRIAMRAPDDFGRLLAAGLTTIFAIQSFIILGGVSGLLPLTGITLPFMSYGGSSLLSNFILMALLLRISDAGSASQESAPAQTAEILIGGRR
ncbi:MAG: FtsW/RodA/SpoVE family cell cycle protein [Actinomycetota bacterium]|nr:FtsW/RodA/SpoVE family cell cycle protein [Actinomycetota bacterium]